MAESLRSKEGSLTLIALITGGILPLLIVFGSARLLPMPSLFWAVGVPAEIVLFGVLLYARSAGLERLYRRLWVGVIGGVLLTLSLDAVRAAGVNIGYLPDSVSMFGRFIFGVGMKAKVTPGIYIVGLFYHFFNGIAFGVVYSILFGKTRWWGAVLYSVFFVELGMMTLPPMAKMMGPFGVNKFGTIWNGMFMTTLLAHVAMGVALGAVIQKWGEYPGLLFANGRKGV